MAEDLTPDAMLPPNASPLMRAVSRADARLLDVNTEFLRTLNDPATCPAELLPYLAHRRAVRVWDPTWPIATMRAVVSSAYAVKARGGTRGALEDALDALGIGLRVEEWFEYGGAPYRFRLSLTLPPGEGWDARQQGVIFRTARQAKNARSRLEALQIHASGSGAPVYMSAVVHSRIRVKPRRA